MDAGRSRRAPLLAVLLALGGLGLILAGGWRGAASGETKGTAQTETLVVAARSLDAGTVLTADDVSEVRAPGATPLDGMAHASSDVVGRRLAVAVPPGAPLGTMVLSGVPVPAAGRRLVRLAVDSAALPPDVAPGTTVDVLAAVISGADGGRVLEVASGRVVAATGGSSPVVTLDVDASGAARLFWAQTFAKSLRVLARGADADERPPPDVPGLG